MSDWIVKPPNCPFCGNEPEALTPLKATIDEALMAKPDLICSGLTCPLHFRPPFTWEEWHLRAPLEIDSSHPIHLVAEALNSYGKDDPEFQDRMGSLLGIFPPTGTEDGTRKPVRLEDIVAMLARINREQPSVEESLAAAELLRAALARQRKGRDETKPTATPDAAEG